jgi:hypothetical protein
MIDCLNVEPHILKDLGRIIWHHGDSMLDQEG